MERENAKILWVLSSSLLLCKAMNDWTKNREGERLHLQENLYFEKLFCY